MAQRHIKTQKSDPMFAGLGVLAAILAVFTVLMSMNAQAGPIVAELYDTAPR
ncbi:MAG: hypothetical protein AAF386_03955 [Pseudomonadota bacterium]